MKAIKAFITLVFAVALGLIIHFNWEWLNLSKPIVVFSYEYGDGAEAMVYRLQTLALPLWVYLFGALFIGALFIAVASMVDIFRARREAKAAKADLRDLKLRFGLPLEGKENEEGMEFSGDSTDEDVHR